ncbi:MAG TPA: hypothetical protein VNO22_17670 [Planctomycetota bacterium]|nr:hypothetical protein [Planctomycetota bacterium]
MARLLAAALLSAAALSGCVQYEQATTLFPDGSGKFTMSMAFKKSLLKMITETAKQLGGEGGAAADPLAEFQDPEKLGANSEGVVAWAQPRRSEEGEWVRVSVTGYFEDINKVRIYNQSPAPGEGPGGRKTMFACVYEKTDAGYVLKLQNEGTNEFKKMRGENAPDGQEDLAKAMIEALKPMLEGLKFSVSITVPGPILEAQGVLETKDRTASLAIDAKTLVEAMSNPSSPEAKRFKTLEEFKEMRLVWKENSVPASETSAFKKELADAKAQWAKTLEEHRARKAAEKK